MYFITDCNGQIVGNRKGYPTLTGAHRQAHSSRSKVHAEIWYRFNNKREAFPDWTLVCKVQEADELKQKSGFETELEFIGGK